MQSFADIIGQASIKEHLRKSLQTGKISHAYIFYGEKGSGKKTLADLFARALQCESGEAEPCNQCISCKQAMNRNQPDIIYLQHEKPNVISVDEIRRQINNDIGIKPYSSERKIYIIDEAEKMNVQAQNALLKTLEEPPAYATILLLTTNLEAMLQTIRSRCVTLTIKPIADTEIQRYLMREVQIPDYKAGICAAFARGNVGRARELAVSAEFEELKEETLQLVQRLSEKSLSDLAAVAKSKAEKGSNTEGFLELIQMWYRDVLMYKSTGSGQVLIFSEELPSIKKLAHQLTYEGLNRILETVEVTRTRLAGNVNAELTLEWLLLVMHSGGNGGSRG
ncbi:MAG: DNA polymerase III subunit delta' [Lachnospiraceae bacterium]|nr:DNA polymerase III subunit delta' [Lachnospiraceae bacterium]